jgi:hypothetical protein
VRKETEEAEAVEGIEVDMEGGAVR